MDPIYRLTELGVCIKPDSGSKLNDNLCRIFSAQKWSLVKPIFVFDAFYLKGFLSLLSVKVGNEMLMLMDWLLPLLFYKEWSQFGSWQMRARCQVCDLHNFSQKMNRWKRVFNWTQELLDAYPVCITFLSFRIRTQQQSFMPCNTNLHLSSCFISTPIKDWIKTVRCRCGGLALANSKCPPSCSVSPFLNGTGVENRMKRLIASDKDREIAYQLLLWTKQAQLGED